MTDIVTIIVFLLVLSLAVWIIEQIPLPVVPRRIATAAVGLLVLIYILQRGHLLR